MKNVLRTGHSARTALATTALALCGAVWNADAQFSITTGTGNTSQDFDGLSSSGTANAWTNDLEPTPGTLDGWSLFTFGGTPITGYRASAGPASETTGSFYSYGSTSSTERALGGTGSGGAYFGSPPTGAVAGYIAFAATNNSASTVTSFTLGFDGEQWRNGGNTSAQTMVLEYGFGATFGGVTTWTAPGGAFDWASPVVGAAAAPVDGNVAGLVAARGGAVNGLTWLNGDTLWLRWIERNDAGNDHGLAIDNFSLSWIAATLPKNLTWTPASADWDTSATNWQEAGPPAITFSTGDTVNFTDSGLAGSATVTVAVGGVNPGAVNVSNTTGTYTISGGAITAVPPLAKSGGGNLVLGSTYSSGLTVSGGGVRTAANEVLGDTSPVSLGDSTSLDLDGHDETIGALTLTGASVTTGTGTLAVGGDITLMVPAGANGTTIAGKMTTVGNNTRKITLVDGTAAEDLVLSADISGTGRLDFDGAGVVRISGNNSSHTNSFQIDSGATYILGSLHPIGTGQLFLNGGTLQIDAALTGANKLTAPVSLGGNGVIFNGQSIEFGGALSFFGAGVKTYAVADEQTLTFSGTLDSSRQPGQTSDPNPAITKVGAGKMVITGSAVDYNGNATRSSILTVSEGRVDLLTALGAGNASIHDSATLYIAASQTLTDLTIDDGAVATLGTPPPSLDLAGGELAAVPEPGSGMLLLGGLVTLMGFRRSVRRPASELA